MTVNTFVSYVYRYLARTVWLNLERYNTPSMTRQHNTTHVTLDRHSWEILRQQVRITRSRNADPLINRTLMAS